MRSPSSGSGAQLWAAHCYPKPDRRYLTRLPRSAAAAPRPSAAAPLDGVLESKGARSQWGGDSDSQVREANAVDPLESVWQVLERVTERHEIDEPRRRQGCGLVRPSLDLARSSCESCADEDARAGRGLRQQKGPCWRLAVRAPGRIERTCVAVYRPVVRRLDHPEVPIYRKFARTTPPLGAPSCQCMQFRLALSEPWHRRHVRA